MMSQQSSTYLNMDNDHISNKIIIITSIAMVMVAAVNSIIFPMLINSFRINEGYPNSYFVALMITTFNMLISMIMVAWDYKKDRTISIIGSFQDQKIFLKIGVYRALQIMLTSYASDPKRTPMDIQSILNGLCVPITLLLSRLILSTRMTRIQTIGSFIIVIGGILCTIPSWPIHGQTQNFGIMNLLWSLVFIGGLISYVMINIQCGIALKKDDAVNKIGLMQLMAWSRFYQLIICCSLFWINFTGKLASYNSFKDWSIDMQLATKLFFSPSKAFVYGILSISLAFFIGWLSAFIIKHRSVNFNIMVFGFVPSVSVTILIIFPSLNPVPITTFAIIMDYVSVFVIGIGMMIWKYAHTDNTKNITIPLINKNITDSNSDVSYL